MKLKWQFIESANLYRAAYKNECFDIVCHWRDDIYKIFRQRPNSNMWSMIGEDHSVRAAKKRVSQYLSEENKA